MRIPVSKWRFQTAAKTDYYTSPCGQYAVYRDLMPPHFYILFPFFSDIYDEELKNQCEKIISLERVEEIYYENFAK